MEHIYVKMSRRQQKTITGFWRIGWPMYSILQMFRVGWQECWMREETSRSCHRVNFAGRVADDFATSNTYILCLPASIYKACSVSYVSQACNFCVIQTFCFSVRSCKYIADKRQKLVQVSASRPASQSEVIRKINWCAMTRAKTWETSRSSF